MNISKEELTLIANSTTMQERQVVANKSGYNINTVSGILYGTNIVTSRNAVVIRLLAKRALANTRRDLKRLENLNNKLK